MKLAVWSVGLAVIWGPLLIMAIFILQRGSPTSAPNGSTPGSLASSL